MKGNWQPQRSADMYALVAPMCFTVFHRFSSFLFVFLLFFIIFLPICSCVFSQIDSWKIVDFAKSSFVASFQQQFEKPTILQIHLWPFVMTIDKIKETRLGQNCWSLRISSKTSLVSGLNVPWRHTSVSRLFGGERGMNWTKRCQYFESH